MKPKLTDLIPIYGFIYYFKRYFKTLIKPTTKDIEIATYMELYHIFIPIILIMGIIKFIL
jgi:hypothetical protein